MAYCTKDDVANLIGAFTIPAHYTDPRVADAIARAMSRIDRFTRMRFEPSTRTMVLSGDGTCELSLMGMTTWPLRSITSIKYRSDFGADFDAAGEALDAADYAMHASRRFITHVRSIWIKGVQNYQVVAVLGKKKVPTIVKEATVLLVRNEMEPGHLDDWMPMYSERFQDGYSYTRNMEVTTLPPTANTATTTGHPMVDRILRGVVFNMPFKAIGI